MTGRLRISALAAAACVFWVAAFAAAAGAAPVLSPSVRQALSRGSYESRVHEAASLASGAAKVAERPASAAEVDRVLSRIRSLLPAREHTIFSGHLVEVDNRALLDTIDAARAASPGAERRRIVGVMARGLATLDEGISSAGSRPGDRRALAAALDEARAGRPDLLTQLSARIATWFRQTFGDRFDLSPALAARPIPAPPTWLLVSAALLIILTTSALLARLILRRRRVVAVRTPDVHETAGEQLPEEDPRERALERARAGDRREAVRLLFRSLQYRLDGMRIVRRRRAQTDYEYLDSVRKAGSALEGPVRAMIGTFERKYYGLQDCDAAEFEQFERMYRGALEAAERLGGER